MKKDKDDFNKLWTDTNDDPLDDPLETEAKALRRAAKITAQTARHIGCPMEWLEQILPHVQGECQLVVALLMYRQWVLCGRPRTFNLPNKEMSHLGIDRAVKARMLARLEEAGLISVQQRHGHAPQITRRWK